MEDRVGTPSAVGEALTAALTEAPDLQPAPVTPTETAKAPPPILSLSAVLPVTATTTLSATVAAVQVVPGHELPPPTPPRRLCRAPPIRTPLAPVASRPHFVVIVRVADAKLPVQPVVLRQQTRLGSARRLRPLLRLMPDCRARAPLPFGRVVRSPSLR